jgi:hypothetical protein
MQLFLIVFGFLFLTFAFMLLMLRFSKYKQKGETCCSDGIVHDDLVESCFTCPHYDEDRCENTERVNLADAK